MFSHVSYLESIGVDHNNGLVTCFLNMFYMFLVGKKISVSFLCFRCSTMLFSLNMMMMMMMMISAASKLLSLWGHHLELKKNYLAGDDDNDASCLRTICVLYFFLSQIFISIIMFTCTHCLDY